MDPIKQPEDPANNNPLPLQPSQTGPEPASTVQPENIPNQPPVSGPGTQDIQSNPFKPSAASDLAGVTAAGPNPFAGPQPVIGNFEPTTLKPVNNKRKKLFVAAGAALVLTLAITGFVFGYYLPNKPENAYRTGIERSGDAIHQLILQSTETEKLQQIKKTEIEGSLEITSDYGNVKGSFSAKLDPTKTDSSLDVTFNENDSPEQRYGLKLLTELKDDKRFPDAYFQLSGIKAAGLDGFMPGISDYDGKWIAVEADYLESLSSGFLPPEEKENKENISADEIAELIRIISETTNEYLFSTDPDKAVLENREYLGKETTNEGIESFHYKVGVNREHAIDYCKALTEKVFSTRAVKKLADASDEEIEKTKNETIKDCDETGKDLKDSDTFDMWIDAKYKVIHKFRVYAEENKKDTYTDIGQIYTGGDKLSFFALYHEDENNLNVKFTLDVDVNALNSKAEITASQEGDDKFNGIGSITAKPYEGEINTDRPDGAISIDEILKKFGFDPTYQSGITQSPEAQNALAKRCAAAYENLANNNGEGDIPPECQ